MTHITGKVSYSVGRGHLLADDDLSRLLKARVLMTRPLGATAMDECVDTGASPVNEHGNTSENQADTIVVHSDLIGEL